MKGNDFLNALKKQLPGTNQTELSRLLGKSSVQLSQMKRNDVSPLMIARLIKRLNTQIISGTDLILEVKRRLQVSTDTKAANLLGVTPPALVTWRKQLVGISARQIANALSSARKAGTAAAYESAFRPIIEMFPITPHEKKTSYDVFSDKNGNKQRVGLKDELLNTRGIYIFYDTRGKALYAGKASNQSIWKEMNLAFNRDRSAQKILLVKHPINNIKYSAAHEKLRQPVETSRRLLNLAAYFSAYSIDPALIDDFEALFIRAFPNDLLNSKMEKMRKRKASANQRSRSKLDPKKTRSTKALR